MTKNQRVKWIRRAARTLAVVVLAAIAYLVLAPTGRYLLRAAWEEGKILARRRPIPELVADPATPAPLRAKLALVLSAREFAHDSLGLETGQSFTSFSRLDRDTLVLVLSGAYRDKLRSRTWWFPIVGRVPYKGYFDFDAAREAERELTASGFDARLGAASAFSTLGWFNDPLLPTTLRADSLTVANTVMHELTHNTFYAPGGAVFNESFANFVGARGAERFFLARGQTAAAQIVVDRWEDEKVIGRFWASLYARVDSAFKARPGEEPERVAARIAVRDSIYAQARATLRDTVAPQLRTMKIGPTQRIRIDNSVLMARRVYLTELDAFDAVLALHGRDLRRTIAAIVDAAKADRKHPFEAVRALARGSVTR
ncbi:MAG TPA: aminopeptidase [Gemmatimonadaceae bacterium]|nr:aminopeptidase [Gemmatimonadaceae bacterium]